MHQVDLQPDVTRESLLFHAVHDDIRVPVPFLVSNMHQVYLQPGGTRESLLFRAVHDDI